jgi:hypothetical protein
LEAEVCLAGQSVTDSSQEVMVTTVEETSVSVKVAAEAMAAVAAKMATVENCILLTKVSSWRVDTEKNVNTLVPYPLSTHGISVYESQLIS